MERQENGAPPGVAKIILFGIVLLVAGSGAYYGYRQMTTQHAREIETLDRERKRLEEKAVLLEQQLDEFREELVAAEPPVAPVERVSEVFGEPAEKPSPDRCADLKQKITAFFDYLDRKDYATPYPGDAGAYQLYAQTVRDLSERLPLVTGETRDIISLTHNSAHFFRVLRKHRIQFVKDILTHERDILESTLAVFYEFFTLADCNGEGRPARPSPVVLYEYAGFFLNTLSGKSYLLRRDSAVRALITYYSILILDRANDEHLNKYGIDIRPHIDFALNDIGNQKNLGFRKRYVSELRALAEKYHPSRPAGP